MLTRRLSISLALGLGLTAWALSTSAWANAITGKANVVCATLNVVACTDGTCLQGQAQTFDFPTFMYIDPKRKLVHADDAKGKEVASPIKNFEVTDNAIILQGFENHRGWTMGIDRNSGELAMSSTGSEVTFTAFGNCTEI